MSKEAYEAMASKDEPRASKQRDSRACAEMGDSIQKVTSNERTAEEPTLLQKVTPSERTAEEPTLQEATTSIGKSKKKRLAKVVGNHSELTQTGSKQDINESPERSKRVKRSKKIKLSFDEME